ncbi:hypothetical protein Syun_004638 [Stephania yunnanensis]|uniref:Uncharacterized protein n=1 Tax=Stephania yunnanensis TaxID=152371 RepID=A0AAP0Q562_9MAGN
MFEGMGLGRCILQAEYKFFKKSVMVFFFSVTTPFGIALGIALSSVYKENSPSSLITVGLLNASSAGLLIYMALDNDDQELVANSWKNGEVRTFEFWRSGVTISLIKETGDLKKIMEDQRWRDGRCEGSGVGKGSGVNGGERGREG